MLIFVESFEFLDHKFDAYQFAKLKFEGFELCNLNRIFSAEKERKQVLLDV